MDSPVIVDTASKFGRNLDLGFPFDDEGFGRRSDIRSHLDDLAARHPEFADHLLGPAWGDAPFTGSLRNRRRGSSHNTNNNNHQHHHQSNNQDEDTRSQASGSSATSAASGASGVSSHGEPEQLYQQEQQEPTTSSSSTTTTTTTNNNNKIPQYGLRNTVDIGQHRHNIMNQDKDNRGQRSMSAPPENRQGTDEQQIPNQNIQNNPRFVSRVDITPQINPLTGEKINQSPPQQQQQQPSSQQQQQQQQPSSQQPQQSNVRHIPIFVEGRDTPVVPKNIDEPIYHRPHQPSPPPRFHRDTTQYDIPPEFHSPPHFQRPSHFSQHYVNKHNPWSGFQDQFSRDTFDHPGLRKTTQQTNPSAASPPTAASYRQNKFNNNNNNNINDNFNKTKKQSHHDDIDNATVTEPPIRKQTVPIDALEKVSLVQNEVDSLTEQVKLWNGNTRKDKQYIYLDEMLTRELIKLDDIDTEGKENVRQARKNAIKSIQDSISLLESKAPIGDQINNNKIIEQQQQQQQPMDIQAPEVEKVQVDNNVEKMEIEKKSEDEDIVNKAIPLPPGPTSLSPVQSTSDNQINLQNKIDDKIIVNPNVAIPLEAAPVAPEIKMDVQSNESTQNNDSKINEKNKNNNDDKKTLKKMKKIKKQTPISSEPIPLPAPEIHQTLK